MNKSEYISGLICPKALWLEIWQPELKEVSTALGCVERQFQELKILAQGLVQGGSLIPTTGLTQSERLNLTELALRNDQTIYDACFLHNDCLIVVDILNKGKVGWELYDVQYSGIMDSICLEELAFQYYAVTECGLPLAKAIVLQVNNKYSKRGKLDPAKLFTSNNLTRDVKDILLNVSENVEKLSEILEDSEPDVRIGFYCNNPYECAFKGYCWYNIPYDSVFDLQGYGINKYSCYRSGIIRLEELQPSLLHGKQRIQVETALNKKVHISLKQLNEFLSTSWHPRCFLDIDDISTVIPLYDGLHPHQPLAISFSIHIQEHRDSKLSHCEFRPKSTEDPRKDLLVNLIKNIPENACIIVYDKARVADLLRGLASTSIELNRKVRHVLDNMIDLMEPFKAWHIYSWRQRGEHSLNSVLSAFVNDWNQNEPVDSIRLNLTDIWFRHWLKADMATIGDTDSLNNMLGELSIIQRNRSNGMARLLDVMEQHNTKVKHFGGYGRDYETFQK